MTEIPKRLSPLPATARELYMYSGNECAFKRCTRRIINEDGIYVGELCHIEGALPEGERFNAKMTNDERRSFDNLVLMCHEHHVVTDDVLVWTVPEMRRLKSEHEATYRTAVNRIVDEITDSTANNQVRQAVTLNRFAKALEFDRFESDVLRDVNDYAFRLANVTEESRRVLAVFVRRARGAHRRSAVLELPVAELVRSVQRDFSVVRSWILELAETGFLDTDLDGEMYGAQYSVWSPNDVGLELDELQAFCNTTDVNPTQILVELRFDLLD